MESKSERIDKYTNCPNSEQIQYHIGLVEAVQKNIKQGMREHEESWEKLLKS